MLVRIYHLFCCWPLLWAPFSESHFSTGFFVFGPFGEIPSTQWSNCCYWSCFWSFLACRSLIWPKLFFEFLAVFFTRWVFFFRIHVRVMGGEGMQHCMSVTDHNASSMGAPTAYGASNCYPPLIFFSCFLSHQPQIERMMMGGRYKVWMRTRRDAGLIMRRAQASSFSIVGVSTYPSFYPYPSSYS